VFANDAGVAIVNLVAAGVYVLGLLAYQTRPGAWSEVASEAGSGTGRVTTGMLPAASRRLLVGGGVSFLVSVVLGREIIGALPSLPPRPDEAAASTGPPTSATPASPAVALPSAVTPADRFYVVSKNLIDPVVDANSWHLSIGGLVGHPLTL